MLHALWAWKGWLGPPARRGFLGGGEVSTPSTGAEGEARPTDLSRARSLLWTAHLAPRVEGHPEPPASTLEENGIHF